MQLTCSPKDYETLCKWRDEGKGVIRLGLGDYIPADRNDATLEQLRMAIRLSKPS